MSSTRWPPSISSHRKEASTELGTSQATVYQYGQERVELYAIVILLYWLLSPISISAEVIARRK